MEGRCEYGYSEDHFRAVRAKGNADVRCVPKAERAAPGSPGRHSRVKGYHIILLEVFVGRLSSESYAVTGGNGVMDLVLLRDGVFYLVGNCVVRRMRSQARCANLQASRRDAFLLSVKYTDMERARRTCSSGFSILHFGLRLTPCFWFLSDLVTLSVHRYLLSLHLRH